MDYEGVIKLIMEEKNNIENASDSAHWKLKYFYYNKDDKRTMVPSRNPKRGPTFNFASPYTYYVLIAVVITVLLMAIIPDLITGRNKQ
jgi:uncharacterized membrane protein